MTVPLYVCIRVVGEAATYKISVKTSDVGGAGTDANVFVVLFGEYGDSGEIHLKESETNRDPFETGRTDVFTVANVLDLGRLVKLRVWHDNKGRFTSTYRTTHMQDTRIAWYLLLPGVCSSACAHAYIYC